MITLVSPPVTVRRSALPLALLLLAPLAALASELAPPSASLPLAPLTPPPHARLALGTLTVGKKTYHEVRVRSRDARSLVFTHRDGLGSARLRDLPAELQIRLGYDPATAPPDTPPPRPAPATARPSRPATAAVSRQLDQLFLAYDHPPELRPLQSLQPEFIALGLVAKNQGRRPSCAIYSIVSALEFQNARLVGGIEKLSEEYLVWATRRSLGLTGPAASLLRDAETGEFSEDTGFSLPSVIAALQTYGIPLYEDMRNQPGLAADDVPEPTPEIIARARARRLVFISPLPGREPAVLLPRLIQALNAGFPVPVGLAWPNERSIRAGVLAAQTPAPDSFHAVTVIGYECPTGRLEDTVFIFKNSYGPRWGQGGYGRATHAYLSRHLLDAYVLDVRPPPSASP
jgi:hypothetical protein